jgi:multiple sugar transport system substrate-binding protein
MGDRWTRTPCALLACAVLAVAGCGDDEAADGGGPSTPAAEGGSIDGAKVAPTLEQARDATGKVTFCAGKDTTGGYARAVERFNERYADQGLEADLLEFPEGSDNQREQAVTRLEARSSECDVIQADIIWIAEFATQKWAMDLTEYVKGREGEFIPSTLEPNEYDGRYWAVPQVTGAGLMYRRTDQVPEAPATWQELYAAAAENDGIAYQGSAYEGLTCNFLEIAFAAGGAPLSEDGTKATLDTPENLAALKLMVDGIESGAAPRGVATYLEEPARRAFESGRVTFMRNWSYAYALNQKAPKVRGKFAVDPLPPFEGGGRAGILGGNGPFLSAYSENPEGGLLFVDHLTSPETLKLNMAEYSLPSVLEETYEDPDVQKAVPYSAELKQAIEQAKPRPVSPVYTQISAAIYKNVNRALSGEVSPEEALAQGHKEIDEALATF